MKRTGKITITLLVLAALSIPMMAQAFGPNQGRSSTDCPRYNSDDSGPYCRFFNLDDKNLTDAQRGQLKKANDEFIAKTNSIRSDMRQKRQELMSQLNSPKPDEQKIWDVQNKISSLRDQMEKEWIKYSLGIKKIAPDASLSALGPVKRHGRFGSYGCPAWN